MIIQSSILGLSSQYPEEREFLLSRLKTEGPYNATGFLAALNRTYYSLRAPLLHWSRDYLVRLSSQISIANLWVTNAVTLNQAAIAYAYQDIGEYFTGGIADITSPIVLNIINRDGIMGYHGVPQMPIFAYKAIEDEISVVGDTDALVDKYCNSKANSILSLATEEKNCANTCVCSRGQHPISAQHRRRSLRRSRQRQTFSIGLAQ